MDNLPVVIHCAVDVFLDEKLYKHIKYKAIPNLLLQKRG